MINNPITRQLLKEKAITQVGVIVLHTDNSFNTFKCRVSKIIYNGDDIIFKLKTGKEYPLGHKYIFRSIEEVI